MIQLSGAQSLHNHLTWLLFPTYDRLSPDMWRTHIFRTISTISSPKENFRQIVVRSVMLLCIVCFSSTDQAKCQSYDRGWLVCNYLWEKVFIISDNRQLDTFLYFTNFVSWSHNNNCSKGCDYTSAKETVPHWLATVQSWRGFCSVFLQRQTHKQWQIRIISKHSRASHCVSS